MAAAFSFIVETLLSLALFVVMARLLLQWTRADFRNPLCQAVVRITNPVILPLRRVLPPIGTITIIIWGQFIMGTARATHTDEQPDRALCALLVDRILMPAKQQCG